MAIDKNRFIKPTRDTLSKRAGQTCSNPNCNIPTSGPHSEATRNIDVGEAAHIRGAKPGSKRFDETMTATERSNITNGIWLCRKCAKLIDSDEIKYSVELLYEWKREHEAKIESPAPFQIAIDQPENWEFLLTVELLRVKLNTIDRDARDLKRGLIYRPSKSIVEKELLLTWIHEKADDLIALSKLLKVATTEELMTAWGAPGQAGNALEILRATNKISEGCFCLLNWEIDLYFTRFPDGAESIKSIMEGWTEQIRQEMHRIPNEISKLFSNDKSPEGSYTIQLLFEASPNLGKIIPALERIWENL